VNGAYAWIDFGVIRFQPSEVTKIAFVLVLARYLRFRSNYRTLSGLLPPFALALVPVAMILRQPDLGTALIFIPALFAMLFVAGAKMKHLLAIVGLGAAMVPIIWLAGTDVPVFRHMPELVKEYQRKRVYAMFSRDPATLQATGYQQENAVIAFGSGGISGKGMGNIPIGMRVPEAHNDMIFALIGEQFGFFGSAVVLAAYIVLFAAGVEIASATREPFGRLIALGVVSLLAGQTFLNLMVATRMMPVTGITLPFVSYGGSSLLASFIAVGLLLNIGQNRPLVIARESFEF
jgi:cell division protein FtsW (lipid II flippase)